ncbi:unnamed protein product, partial [Ectocarpus sp. 12 AP-2014]
CNWPVDIAPGSRTRPRRTTTEVHTRPALHRTAGCVKVVGPAWIFKRLRTDGAGTSNKMASSHEASVPKLNPPSAAASGDRA